MDAIARERGEWPDSYMVYGVEVIGNMDAKDPHVMLTGSAASWMPRAKRWKFSGPSGKAVILLSEYRQALPNAARATSKEAQGNG